MVPPKNGVLQLRDLGCFEFAVEPGKCPEGSLPLCAIVKATDSHAKTQPVVRCLFQNLPAVGDVNLAPADRTRMGINPTDHWVVQHKPIAGVVFYPIRRQGIHLFHRKGKSDPQRQVVARRREGRYFIKFKPLGHDVHTLGQTAMTSGHLETHVTP